MPYPTVAGPSYGDSKGVPFSLARHPLRGHTPGWSGRSAGAGPTRPTPTSSSESARPAWSSAGVSCRSCGLRDCPGFCGLFLQPRRMNTSTFLWICGTNAIFLLICVYHLLLFLKNWTTRKQLLRVKYICSNLFMIPFDLWKNRPPGPGLRCTRRRH